MTIADTVLGFLSNPWFLLSLGFWLIIGVLVYLLRNKKEAIYVFFPIIAMLKTKRLNSFIKKISKKFPKFWRIFWTVGIFVSFGLTIFGFYFFFVNLISLIMEPTVQNVVTPLIPGVTIDIPIFMYLLLPLLFIMTTHELAHGIAATIDDIDVKSTGVLAGGLFFLLGGGAFVEVDEREMASKKVERKTRLRIASAGTFVNIITAGIAMVLLLIFPLIISPFYGSQVIQVDTVHQEKDGGFNYKNIESGDVIVGLKKQGSDEDFLELDYWNNKTLENYLYNRTDEISCSVGDNLTLKVYIPQEDTKSQKDITLGPRYDIGIEYEYASKTELKITQVDSKEDTELEEGTIITEINGTEINVEEGVTLESILTTKNLKSLKLKDENGKEYMLDAEVIGVLIGILSKPYWMPLNSISKLFTGGFPDFIYRELIWLWIIAFSISLFNMLPLPIFDGDRVIKELINWGIGEKYEGTKTQTEKFMIDSEKEIYELSEYRVQHIKKIKLIINSEDKTERLNTSKRDNSSEIKIAEDNFTLIDSLNDGFKDAVQLEFKNRNLPENSVLEIKYEYLHDKKKKPKKLILNTLRVITLIIVAGNFILSFLKFGTRIFWV
ncbi:MAG: site-2 protease family protein [Promethearchaeia archaeon]